jgi:hypothetical protein
MKKITFLKLTLFTSLLFSMVAAQAQSENTLASLNPAKKKIVETGSVVSDAGPKGTYLSTFQASFPDATEINWHSYANDLPCVVFNTTGKMNRVFFNKKGKIAYVVSYYSKEMLPAAVLQTMEDFYRDKSIFGVTQISCNNKTAYVLALEDKTSWTDVTIIDNKIESKQVWEKAQF